MILLTYQEYYGEHKELFKPNEFLECVKNENLINRFRDNLDNTDNNMLTIDSYPWLDLGKIPDKHNIEVAESE